MILINTNAGYPMFTYQDNMEFVFEDDCVHFVLAARLSKPNPASNEIFSFPVFDGIADISDDEDDWTYTEVSKFADNIEEIAKTLIQHYPDKSFLLDIKDCIIEKKMGFRWFNPNYKLTILEINSTVFDKENNK